MKSLESKSQPAASGGSEASYDRFVSLFAAHHNRLYAYIMVFVRDRTDADEVFQETAMVLWREFATYDPERPFMPWAKGVAFNRIREYRRSRHHGVQLFAEPVLDLIAADEAEMDDELAERSAALNHCIDQLNDRDRQLVQVYYVRGATGPETADELGRSIFAIRKAIKRIRKTLFACVDKRLAAGDPR